MLNYCIQTKEHSANTLRRNIGLFKTFLNWALENKHTNIKKRLSILRLKKGDTLSFWKKILLKLLLTVDVFLQNTTTAEIYKQNRSLTTCQQQKSKKLLLTGYWAFVAFLNICIDSNSLNNSTINTKSNIFKRNI